jgi:hypothetical protein
VPAGEFLMGSRISTDREKNRIPYAFRQSDAWIDKTEVTHAMCPVLAKMGKTHPA